MSRLVMPGRFPALCVVTLLVSAMMPAAVTAAPITDPVNDFIPTYTGPHNPDLDVISFGAVYNGAFFRLSATMNGAIGTTSTGLYVFGFDRGSHTIGFPNLPLEQGVLFDAVAVATATGAARVVVSGVTTNLPASNLSISGPTLTLDVPVGLLPSTGLAPAEYGINLWPRSGTGGDPVISDFAPDNSDLRADVPEPWSATLLLSGLAGLLIQRRRAAS